MEIFLESKFKLSAHDVEQLVLEKGSRMSMILYLMSFKKEEEEEEEDILPMERYWQKILSNKKIFEQLELYYYTEKALKYPGLVARDMTLTELKIGFTINPLYFAMAFGVPYETCMQLDSPVSESALVYYYAFLLLKETREIEVNTMHDTLKARGYGGDYAIETIVPFGEYKDHLLYKYDVSVVLPGVLKELLKNKVYNLVGLIRERKWIENQIRRVDGVYKLKTNAIRFAEFISDFDHVT
jgi:hypothetical protein